MTGFHWILRRRSLALLLLISLAIASWACFETNVTYTDISLYVVVENPSNNPLQSQSLDIYGSLHRGFDFGSAVVHTEGNVQAELTGQGTQIHVLINEIDPHQVLEFTVKGIPNNQSLESPSFNSTQPFYVSYSSNLTVSYYSLFEAQTLLGKQSLGSYDYYSDSGVNTVGPRNYTWAYLLVMLIAIAFISYGLAFHSRDLWYPFVTLVVVALCALTYAFVGTGIEINEVPDLALFRYLALPAIFHFDFSHITNNLVFFVIACGLLESWIRIRQSRSSVIWFLVAPFLIGNYFPLAGPALQALVLGPQVFKYGTGLSYVIILLSVSLWTYVLIHWRVLVSSRQSVLLVLLSGIVMAPLMNWLVVITLLAPLESQYAIQEGQGHVLIGFVGLVIYGIYYHAWRWKVRNGTDWVLTIRRRHPPTEAKSDDDGRGPSS